MIRPQALAAACTLAVACGGGSSFTQDDLRQARARWESQGLRSYTLSLEIEGDRVEDGIFVVTVRDGKAAQVTRNGQPIGARDPFYTVDGLFDFLRDELGMAQNPAQYWGVPQGSGVSQRAVFDSELGYPKRYLRAVFGSQHNISLKIAVAP